MAQARKVVGSIRIRELPRVVAYLRNFDNACLTKI